MQLKREYGSNRKDEIKRNGNEVLRSVCGVMRMDRVRNEVQRRTVITRELLV